MSNISEKNVQQYADKYAEEARRAELHAMERLGMLPENYKDDAAEDLEYEKFQAVDLENAKDRIAENEYIKDVNNEHPNQGLFGNLAYATIFLWETLCGLKKNYLELLKPHKKTNMPRIEQRRIQNT
jgi:hypothetical protein